MLVSGFFEHVSFALVESTDSLSVLNKSSMSPSGQKSQDNRLGSRTKDKICQCGFRIRIGLQAYLGCKFVLEVCKSTTSSNSFAPVKNPSRIPVKRIDLAIYKANGRLKTTYPN